jgi:signal transduction histidine kinase
VSSAASSGRAKDVLAAAVQCVRGTLEQLHPPLAAGGTDRAEAYLGTLHRKLEQLLAGADPDPIRKWVRANALSTPLLEAIADEVLRIPADPETAVGALEVLRACSAVRAPRPAAQEPRDEEGGEALRSRMRGPGAFELLIEVAHDFRSPLTSILFLAEALRDGHSGPVSEHQRSQLGLVYSAAFGLASVASDVMDLARGQRDLISGEPEPFAPAELFRSVERLVRPLVEEKRLQLRVVAPDRWQLHGHPHALSRVLLNLTTNALKFTDEGFVELGIRAMPHARVEYYVQDTGRGISPEQQRELFQPFKRRTGPQHAGHYFSGSGVGLSIARRLVNAMGSDLVLDSSEEKGSRFSFVLPVLAARI